MGGGGRLGPEVVSRRRLALAVGVGRGHDPVLGCVLLCGGLCPQGDRLDTADRGGMLGRIAVCPACCCGGGFADRERDAGTVGGRQCPKTVALLQAP